MPIKATLVSQNQDRTHVSFIRDSEGPPRPSLHVMSMLATIHFPPKTLVDHRLIFFNYLHSPSFPSLFLPFLPLRSFLIIFASIKAGFICIDRLISHLRFHYSHFLAIIVSYHYGESQ